MKRSASKISWPMLLVTLALNLTGCITPPPRVAPPAGTYQCPQIVTLTDARANAAIFYTTDGSAPTTASTKYTSPFSVSNTDQVQAIALAPGSKVSTVVSVTYTCAPSLSVAGFATAVQQRFNLPQPATPVYFADLHPGAEGYAAAQAIAPFLHWQVSCPGCQLTANFYPNRALPRAQSAVVFVSLLMSQKKVQLLGSSDADRVLANVSDARDLSPVERRYVATAIKTGILPLQEGNIIQGATPLSPAELTTVFQTIQSQFNLPPVGLQ